MSNSQANFAEKMLFVEQVYYCAVDSVFVWDWAICCLYEWRGTWMHPPRLTLAKMLYICCRYWPLLNGPLAVWMYTSDHTLAECRSMFHLPVVFAVFNQFFALAAFALRTQTLLGSGPRLFVSLVGVLLGVTAYQLYVSLRQPGPS
ncbi:hypothetical protein AURDEDRAFT_111657 [Auricularia subglabra TFB-10046 SS5]|nr:hypothetical protein AURDEDRAFT_111657 [Auricularia subglabra TFB-10046 SS5]